MEVCFKSIFKMSFLKQASTHCCFQRWDSLPLAFLTEMFIVSIGECDYSDMNGVSNACSPCYYNGNYNPDCYSIFCEIVHVQVTY